MENSIYKNIRILTKEEEKEAALSGDKEMLVVSHLPFVIAIASRYARLLNMPQILDDLIQEGTIGLMRAVDYFKIQKGYRVSTYARRCISNEICRFISSKLSGVRIPEQVAWRLNDARKLIASSNGDNVNDILDRIDEGTPNGRYLKIAVAVIISGTALSNTVNIEKPLRIGDGTFFVKNLAFDECNQEDNYRVRYDLDIANKLLSCLTDKEREVLILKVRDEWSFVQIGQKFGFSKQRAEQILKKAMSKLERKRKVFLRSSSDQYRLRNGDHHNNV
jgi:RNA polymerase primary sigma factor